MVVLDLRPRPTSPTSSCSSRDEPAPAGRDRRRRARRPARRGPPPGPRRGLPAPGVDPARLRELRRPRLHAAHARLLRPRAAVGRGEAAWRSRGDDGGARRARRGGGRVARHAGAAGARRCASPRRAAPCCSRARAAPARTWSRTGCTTAAPRREGPFIKVHCPSIPAELLESELFGHERGAFTDARHAKAGKIEMAAGGTLYFDQVQDLSPALQAKLLRVVEERRFERLGGTRTIEVDVRFVASSNVDLAEAVRGGALPRGPLPPPERRAAAARAAARAARGRAAARARPSSRASASAGTTAAARLRAGDGRAAAGLPVARQRARAALGGRARRARRAARARCRRRRCRRSSLEQPRRCGPAATAARRSRTSSRPTSATCSTRWAAARRGRPPCSASLARRFGRRGAAYGIG